MIKWFGIGVLMVVSCAMFGIKIRFQNLNASLQNVNLRIAEEEQKIHMLKTEFSYLASPSYLRALSNKYLKLQNVTVAQVAFNPLYEQELKAVKLKQQDKNEIKKVKWRYKHYKNSNERDKRVAVSK